MQRLLIIVLCMLTGCVGAPPVSVNPLVEKPFDGPWGIVLVDLDLETSASMLNSSTLVLPTEPTREVFAIYADLGKEFRLKRLSVPSRPGYSADLTFPGSMKLPVSSAGIYYYGRVIQRGQDLSIDYEKSADVIRRAKQKYPGVFATLRPVNF